METTKRTCMSVPAAFQTPHAAPRFAGRAGCKALAIRPNARLSPRTSQLRVRAAATIEKTKTSPLEELNLAVNAIRFLAIDSVNKANSGHPGMPMGCAPLGYILWNEYMVHNPKHPEWFNHDRFVLSAGHGSMLQYALMHLSGYDLSVSPTARCRRAMMYLQSCLAPFASCLEDT